MNDVNLEPKSAWRSLVQDACWEAVEFRVRRTSWNTLIEKSELCRLAECCLAFGFNNKDLPFAIDGWNEWFQYPVQVQYAVSAVERIAAKKVMSPEKTAEELLAAYTEMLVEREVARRLEGEE